MKLMGLEFRQPKNFFSKVGEKTPNSHVRGLGGYLRLSNLSVKEDTISRRTANDHPLPQAGAQMLAKHGLIEIVRKPNADLTSKKTVPNKMFQMKGEGNVAFLLVGFGCLYDVISIVYICIYCRRIKRIRFDVCKSD